MSDGHKTVLDNVLPDYEPAIKAPSLAEVISRAAFRGISVEQAISEEQRRRYKAYDASSGGVYLIQNPAVWEQRDGTFIRPKPEFQFNLGEARKGATRAKRAGGAREAF